MEEVQFFSMCTLFCFQGVHSSATSSNWSGEGLYTSERDHRNETRVDREHLANLLSGQLEVHLESLRRLRATGVTHQESECDKQTSVDNDRPNEGTNTSCSTSFLFGQLRYVPQTSKTFFTLALPTSLSNVTSASFEVKISKMVATVENQSCFLSSISHKERTTALNRPFPGPEYVIYLPLNVRPGTL